jgi:CRISPR/Cas system-associated exonuclease Cas4 (RecB family)
MSNTVDNGTLKQLSPSSINKFDETQPFGCERRWWFRYVKGLDEPQTGNQFLGESLHALIEARLSKRELGMEPDPEANGLYLAGEKMIEAVAARKVVGVEVPLPGYTLDGIKVNGYADCVTSDGIIDWKTSSDIRRYGKTETDLAVDTQMVIYARAFHPNLSAVKLAHGQFQTKGNKRTNWVEVEVSQEALAVHESNVIVPLVRKMKAAAAETDVTKLPRNEKSCFKCAYKEHCPSNKGESIMSFFSKMQAAPAIPAPVAPPDAPASKPELAAKPVEGFEAVPAPRKMTMIDVPAPAITAPATPVAIAAAAPPPAAAPVVEEPKRKPGRPPGAKNKPKVESMVGPVTQSGAVLVNDAPMTPTEIRIKSVTVTKGYTINVGAFSSVRFDISATAEGSDYATLEAALLKQVEASLEREASKYQAEIDAKTHASVAADKLVCK